MPICVWVVLGVKTSWGHQFDRDALPCWLHGGPSEKAGWPSQDTAAALDCSVHRVTSHCASYVKAATISDWWGAQSSKLSQLSVKSYPRLAQRISKECLARQLRWSMIKHVKHNIEISDCLICIILRPFKVSLLVNLQQSIGRYARDVWCLRQATAFWPSGSRPKPQRAVSGTSRKLHI